MATTLKNRVAIAIGAIGLAWGSVAAAAPLANVSGTWSIVGNQHVGFLTLSQGAGTPCAPINGTIYPGTTVSHADEQSRARNGGSWAGVAGTHTYPAPTLDELHHAARTRARPWLARLLLHHVHAARRFVGSRLRGLRST